MDFDPTSVYQFNHPPLHYAVSALWLRFASLFIGNTAVLEESIQIIPFISSVLTLVFLIRILGLLPMDRRGERLAAAVFAFHPALILLSGSVNNDGGGLLFTVLILYETMRWCRAQEWRTIVFLALWFGLGVMTKQNVAEMALPVGAAFLYIFAKQAGRRRKIVSQWAVFLLIACPLSLWFYLYNYVRWRVPLVWVYTLPEDSWQYVGNVPVVYRFLLPDCSELVSNLRQGRIGCGYNTWIQIFRTSVLGEWDMAGAGRTVKILALLLMAAGALPAVISFIAMLDALLVRGVHYGVRRYDRILLLLTYAVTMLFYLKFVYDYPQQCSMNFRYITVTLVPAAAGAGIVYGSMKKPLRVFAALLTAVFALLSVLMTAVWCAM